MKKRFLLMLIAAVLVSCADKDSASGPVDSGPVEMPYLPPDNIVIPSFPFNREIFDHERQLWLEQGIQNYSFQQKYVRPIPFGGEITVIVKNGDVRYVRKGLWNGGEYREGVLVLPDEERGKRLASDEVLYISISELYEQIDRLANNSSDSGFIDIQYDGALHFPSYVKMMGSNGFQLDISGFVIDPQIPEETSLIFDRNAFTANRDKWAQQGKRDYTFWFDYNNGEGVGFWRGSVVIKDGRLNEIIPDEFYPVLNAQPNDAARTWIGTIDGIFAKIEAEADAYDGGGLLIEIQYHDTGYPQEIRYLRIFPNSPAENSSDKIRISGVELE